MYTNESIAQPTLIYTTESIHVDSLPFSAAIHVETVANSNIMLTYKQTAADPKLKDSRTPNAVHM